MKPLMMIVISFCVSAFATDVPKGYVAAITINPLTEVTTKTVSLAQVAEIVAAEPLKARLGAVSLGLTPRVGNDRIVTPITVQSALRAAGVDVATVYVTGPQTAIVRRESRILPAGELTQFATGWITANMQDVGAVRQTSPGRDLRIASGETGFLVTHSKEIGKSVIITIQISVDGDAQTTQQLVFAKGEVAGSAMPNLKPNDTVRVALISNEVVVEVFGQVKAVNGTKATVFIIETKATLVGEIKSDGSVEVRL